MDQNIDYVFTSIYSTFDTMLEIMNENLISEGLDPTGIVRLRFNRLHQEGSVFEYIERFHELYLVVSNQNQGLLEVIFVECFIKGLNEEFKSWVQKLCPKSLSTAYSHAKIHQYYLEGLVEQDAEKPSLSSKDESLLCDCGQKLRDRDGHSDVSGVETSTWEEEFMVSNEENKCNKEGNSELIASKMFNSLMMDDYYKAYMFKYESDHGVFTGSVTLVDEFTLKINGRKIKVASTSKLEEIPWADYKVDYMAGPKLNRLYWTYFEMVRNVEAYEASEVGVHVPFVMVVRQRQQVFSELHKEMGLLQQMTCNWDNLYSLQRLLISDEATFVFDPGGL